MDMELVRLFVRQVLQEKKNNLLGEPDTTTEKHRDEPQPQYEEEEAEAEEEEEGEDQDTDEASMTAGITGHIGPVGATGYGPGNKPYGQDENE